MTTLKLDKRRSSPIPTRWEDVTYSQYAFHIHPRTFSESISCFTGVPKQTLEDSDIKDLEKIYRALSFMATSPKFMATKMIGPYVLPKGLPIGTLAQYEDLQRLNSKIPKKELRSYTFEDHIFLLSLYLEAAAIYCQKIKDGKYDHNCVTELKEKFKNFSCCEIVGTGSHILFKSCLSLLTLNPN